MAKLVINSYEEFASHLGEKLGESDWLQIDQERINKFADATLDPQWIHVDVERAKVESPYHSTIAHGYLTLSVLPYLWQQIVEVNNIKMLVNYGMDQMRFGQASHHRFTCSPCYHPSRHSEPSWHLQGQHQVRHRDRRSAQACPSPVLPPSCIHFNSIKVAKVHHFQKTRNDNGSRKMDKRCTRFHHSRSVWSPGRLCPQALSFEHGLDEVNREGYRNRSGKQ